MEGFSDSGLEATVTISGGTAEVRLSGELDVLSVGRLRRLMDDVWKEPVSALVIDLSCLSLIDPRGVDVLVDTSRLAREQGIHYEVRHHSPGVQRLASLLDVDQAELLGEVAAIPDEPLNPAAGRLGA